MLDYRIPLTGDVLRAFTLGAHVKAQGSTYWNEANTLRQKAYATLGAHADLEFTHCTLSIWGRNLTDTRYNTFMVETSSMAFAQRGNPIQVGMDVRMHF